MMAIFKYESATFVGSEKFGSFCAPSWGMNPTTAAQMTNMQIIIIFAYG